MIESFLKECLDFAGEKELPQKWDGQRQFYRAICLCEMKTGALEYLIVGFRNGEIYGAKTFGIGMISKFLEVYPYEYGEIDKDVKQIKTSYKDVSTSLYVGEWGVAGISNAEQAYQWVMSNKKGAGNVTRNPDKLKLRIKEILDNQ